MTKEERATMDELLHQLCTALPYVEDAQHDQCLKPGTASKALKGIRAAIERAETLRKSHAIEIQ